MTYSRMVVALTGSVLAIGSAVGDLLGAEDVTATDGNPQFASVPGDESVLGQAGRMAKSEQGAVEASPGTDLAFAGPRFGRRGRGPDASHLADQQLIHRLLDERAKIVRHVRNLPNGVETVTETDDAELRRVLVEHVLSMARRVEDVRPIRMRDPLFRALFGKADQIEMRVEKTKRGVRVTETSSDPFAVQLIQAHARVVSLFIKSGYREARKTHPVPSPNT